MIDLSQLIIDGKYPCTEAQIQEIQKLLSSCPNNSPSLEQMRQMMDDLWDKLGCDNTKLDWEKISAFYNHPVWILNGLSFKIFAKLMGLNLIGACQGSHATLYVKEKEKSFNWRKIRLIEAGSKSLFPVLKSLHRGYRGLKQIVR